MVIIVEYCFGIITKKKENLYLTAYLAFLQICSCLSSKEVSHKPNRPPCRTKTDNTHTCDKVHHMWRQLAVT